MMKTFRGIEEMIGHTPLMALERYTKTFESKAVLLAKVEGLNPAGSVKDRAALSMILDAEKKGVLKKGSVIVEPTSGNTGIGLAAVAAARGYQVILTMPDTMSAERRAMLAAYGAEIVLTQGSRGMQGAVEKAEEILRNTPSAMLAGQFSNAANAQAHYETTGPEIWEDTDGKVDIFVCGVGTGGTITGTGRYLKEKNPDVKVVAVEPADSPLLSQGWAASHKIQGIGANFVPELLDRGIYDDVMVVESQEAFAAARDLVRTEGLLAGISSGAALHAARVLAQKEENAGKLIVALLPDHGDRYLSTGIYTE